MQRVVTIDGFRYNPQTKKIEGFGNEQLEAIRQHIRDYQIVVLRGVFPRQQMNDLRLAMFRHMSDAQPANPPIAQGSPNFYRIDDNPEKSAVKRVNHFYSSFYWNEDVAGEVTYMSAISRLRNIIAKLPEDFTLKGIEANGYFTYPTVTQYPCRGGRLNKHKDPQNIQFCVAIASMSERGADFQRGGLYVEFDDQVYDLDEYLQTGDVYLMNPDIIHGVTDIDPEPGKKPDWKSARGRWTLFPALIELKTTYGEKVAGLTDLDYRGS